MKPLRWVGSSKEDLRRFPRAVQRDIGFALYFAQRGDKHASAKPLKGFHGAGVLEIVENYGHATYRAVYTVRLADAVYVLHVFQKKSKTGIATPKPEMDLIHTRLRMAEQNQTKGG
ncbi:MAG: type II toxin-antitoxin system RelE/ParE family toxin [Proteobacteria bacterium]|nr:type II toxin-antitoxin system RelE/ParE family toxin [Pseudomonadota bacterium]